jgi:RNA polymerase sigma-70 factor, ECF subfamily
MATDIGDHALLRAARRDPEAFEALATSYLPLLRAWALSSTRDVAAANDVAAEALARAWLRRRRYRGRSDASARAWIYGIARNVLREQRRSERFEKNALARLGVELPTPDELAVVDERLVADASADALSEAVDALPDAQREALRLRVIDELPYPEAAARLERSEQATRQLVSRALARLRGAGIGSNP